MLQSPWRIEQIFVLFFSLCEWRKLRSVSNFEACFEANMLNFMGHKAIYISKCQHCPGLSGCLCRRDDFKVRCCLRDFPWDCLTCRCNVLQQCKLWQESKLWNLSISIKATVATVGHKASHTNMCTWYFFIRTAVLVFFCVALWRWFRGRIFLHTCEKAYPSLGVTMPFLWKNQDWPLEVAGAKLGGWR